MNITGGGGATTQRNQTVPTSIGALLTEEYTLDPLSHQPSFLELTFVDVARNSGRVALSAMWEVGVKWLEGVLGRLQRMERLADRLLSYSLAATSESSTNSLAALSKTIKTTIRQIKLWYYFHLRRMCHVIHRTVKTFGPELQILILFAIDYNCIHHLSGSTACEMVYGLKRSKLVKILPSGNDQSSSTTTSTNRNDGQYKVVELSKRDKTMSAFLAALFPYFKQRCDNWFKQMKEQSEEDTDARIQISQQRFNLTRHTQTSTNSTNKIILHDKIKQKCAEFYPYLHMSHELTIFLYQFAYLLGFSPYWSFSMHTLRVMLRRMTVADVQEQQKQRSKNMLKAGDGAGMITKNNAPPLKPGSMIKVALLFSVSYVLLSGWASHFRREMRLRRRRWIAGEESSTSNDESAAGDGNSGVSRKKLQFPIPPPPLKPELSVNNGNRRHIDDKWSCPICHESRINPTASTSGYVFCYRCLIMHLRQKGEYCPVTGMPCKESMVVRLFEPTVTNRSSNNRRPNRLNR